MSKLISTIIPVYNEQDNIPVMYEALTNVWKELRDSYDYELIFVNDGSKDTSGEIIEKLAATDPRVKYIEFSRNFGKEIATSAGIHGARGDAALLIDADLQHPVELIPEFLDKWGRGADIVVGVRACNTGEGFVKKYGSLCFYKIMNAIGDTEVTPLATDYRLIDKKVITVFNCFTERNRMTRGLLDWLGFKKEYISFTAQERFSGEPAYRFSQLVKLALSAFVSHSLFPLKFAGYLGIFITFFSGTFGVFILVEKYAFRDPLHLNFSGTAFLATLIIFLVGIVLVSLGLIALYIATIHGEVTNRPLYVVRRKENFNESM